MSIFRNGMARLGLPLFQGGRVTLRFCMTARIARYLAPLIGKLAADDPDGETYRCAIAAWQHSKRPPLAIYQGDLSTCRIDGPLQNAGRHYLPLGGLIETPGVTAHLNPVEAEALDRHLRAAIDRTIRAWVADHELDGLPPVSPDIDRPAADREALALIAQVAGWQVPGGQFAMIEPAAPSCNVAGLRCFASSQ